jgi:hypothetical protein
LKDRDKDKLGDRNTTKESGTIMGKNPNTQMLSKRSSQAITNSHIIPELSQASSIPQPALDSETAYAAWGFTLTNDALTFDDLGSSVHRH